MKINVVVFLLAALTVPLPAGDSSDALKADLASGDREKIVAAIARVESERLEALYQDVYQAFKASRDATIRRKALSQMSNCGAPQVPQMIREAISDPKATDIDMRHFGTYEIALRRITKTKDNSVIFAALRKAISDSDIYYRKHGAAVVASYTPALKEFADQLSKIAQDPNAVVRYTFLSKLTVDAEVSDVVLPLLLESVRSSDPSDRIAAAFTLAKFKDWPKQHRAEADGLIEFLVSELRESNVERAEAAGWALVFLRAWPDVLTRVKAKLASGSPQEVVLAATILDETGEQFDQKKLQPAVTNGDEDVQLRATLLLSRGPSLAGIRLLESALASESARVRRAAVFGLRACGWIAEFTEVGVVPDGERVSMLVLKAKRTAEEQDRFAAVSRALEKATSSPDQTVSRLATDALVRIGASSQPSTEQLIDYDRWKKRAAERRKRVLNDVAGTIIEKRDRLEIGTQKQLFIDDFIVDRMDGMERVAHPFKKHPANPVFHAQVPWEENWANNYMCSVHYDQETRDFKMWYRCGANQTLGGYAVSEDGVRWHRPNLGRVEYKGSRNNNLLGWRRKLYRDADPVGANIVLVPSAPQKKRYLSFFAYSGQEPGFYVSYSPEGIAWSEPEHAQVVHGDVATLIPDPLRGGLLLFPKKALWVDGYRRSFGFTPVETVKEATPRIYPFTALTEKHDELVGREAARSFGVLARGTLDPSAAGYGSIWHTQVYIVTPVVYEGLVLGLYALWYLTGHIEGPLEMLMMASRDLENWYHVGYPKAMLPRGRPGEWDAGMILGGSNILVVDDEIRVYYSGFNFGHNKMGIPWSSKPDHIIGVGLATLRLDGFVSVRAQEQGTLTTKPFTFAGQKLVVNADADGGTIRVEILDQRGQPIPGFAVTACDPIDDDAIRQTVTWSGDADVSKLAGKEIRLRLLMRSADLYSFQFK